MSKSIKIILIFSLGLMFTACGSSPKKNDGPNLKKASDINVQLGAEYIKQKDYKTAKDKLDKALEQNPDNSLAHSTMALLLEKVGKFDEVEDFYKEAIDLDKDNSDIKNNYGTFLCNRGRYEDANKQFEIAINDPYYKTHVVAMINAGKCAYQNKDFKKAEDYLRQALRKNPQLPQALYLMGRLGLDTKRYLMTRAYIQRFHSIRKESANSLWILIQAEKALGDRKVVRDLIEKLNKKFPDSNEAGKAMGLMR